MGDELLFEMADAKGISYNGATDQPEREPEVTRSVTGDYLFTWVTANDEYVRVTVADVSFVRGEMQCRLSVAYKSHKGDKPRTLLSRKRWILESNSSTSSQFTELNRWKAVNVDWPATLTTVSTYFETNFETGDPFVWLDEVEDPGPLSYLVEPLVQANEHTLIGADGGSLKSMTALGICLTLATNRAIIPGLEPKLGKPVKSLYIDYETSASTHRRRLQALAKAKGVSIPKGMIGYKRLHTPLSHMKAELNQLIALQGIEFVVVDSVGRAVGGETVAEAEVQNYYNATSAFGVTMLSIGHTSKSNPDTVAGNNQWKQQARSMWIFEAAKEHGSNSVVVGMHHRKVNEGELLPSMNYAVSFGNDAVAYAQADDEDVAQLAGTDLKTAVRIYLGENPNSTTSQIAKALDKTEQRIGTVLRSWTPELWKSDGARPAKWILQTPVYKPRLEGDGVLNPLKGFNTPRTGPDSGSKTEGLEKEKTYRMPYTDPDSEDVQDLSF